ncbi:MAG: hypothetical protein JNK53_04455, partial [Phycisphaerae bacterium]|nr:hypothetical protein [Phycisphaerae bacterium]
MPPVAPVDPVAPVAPAPAPSRPAADGLETDALVIEPLGLRFRPPANSIMRSDGVGRTAQWTLTERSDSPKYIMKVTRLVVAAEQSTPAAQIDEYIRSMSERPADAENATVFSVKSRQSFKVGSAPAGLVYATLRESDGLAAIQGYFMLQSEANEFLVISVLMAEEDFATVSPMLERSFRTAELV